MKRALLMSTVLLFACHAQEPKFSDQQMDKMRSELSYLTDACLNKIRCDGIEALKGGDDCTRRFPSRRWRGLWRDDFEGQLFCPAPARTCANSRQGGGTWFDLDPRPGVLKRVDPGGLYAVDFVGRLSSRGTPMKAYGYQQDIVVDRLISIKQVEPPPPPPTEDQMMERMIADQASGTFLPNAQTKNEMQQYLAKKRKRIQQKM